MKGVTDQNSSFVKTPLQYVLLQGCQDCAPALVVDITESKAWQENITAKLINRGLLVLDRIFRDGQMCSSLRIFQERKKVQLPSAPCLVQVGAIFFVGLEPGVVGDALRAV